MSNKIGIDVQANLDTQGVDQGVRELEQRISQVNRNPINPVSDKGLRQLDEVNKRFQQLLKVHTELSRRIKATGQQGALFQNIDWTQTHPNQQARQRALGGVHDYLGIPRDPRHAPVPPPPPHPGRPGGGNGGQGGDGPAGGGGGFAGGAANVVQAGLRGAGPVGNVAANAVGTGMSSGVGAGLGGLLGGMLALGISKIVGGVMEKVGQAEDNSVGYDKLKRTIGDVNVSFEALKSVVVSGADNLKVTYSEFTGLSSQFAKSANMSAGQFGSLGGEVGTGVGLSRSYGLDPSAGVGMLGQMRGLGITKDVQESRKFALLIGETIGKSGAFAKADEVMEAMGNYAQAQTRAGMGGANMAGYGGMFSSMVGSGIGGMDPSGAASLLNRINGALTGGGAKGEASQFFTARVGKSMGLDPIQTQIMREGGAFATNDNSFGPGSAAARYGIKGPTGDKTFLQGTIDQATNDYQDKGLRAQAVANHLGVNMRQSMALMSLKPNSMGQMEKYAGDLTKLDATGIGNIAKVVDGTDSDRRGVADGLMRNNKISGEEKRNLDGVMGGKDVELQKSTLAALVAKYGQEQTQGSDIRDSKNALDNIKTSIADKLVPLTLEMRHGIMAIAGGGKKSSEEVMSDVVKLDSDARAKAIVGRFTGEKGDLEERQNTLEAKKRSLDPVALARTYGDKPDILEKKLKERVAVQDELTHVEKRLKEIEETKADLLKKENERKQKELAEIREGMDARWNMDGGGAAGPGSGAGPSGGGSGGSSGGGGGGGSSRVGPVDPKKRDEAMAFFMKKGWTKEQSAGIVANFAGESAMSNTAVGDGGQAYGLAQWHPDRQAEFKKKYGKDIKGSTHEEQMEFAHYELTEGKEQSAGNLLKKARGAGQAAEIVSRYYERPKDANGAASARAAAAEKIAAVSATPLPPGAGAGRGDDPRKFHVSADPIVVQHQNAKGEQIAPSQVIKTRVGPARPFGGGA